MLCSYMRVRHERGNRRDVWMVSHAPVHISLVCLVSGERICACDLSTVIPNNRVQILSVCRCERVCLQGCEYSLFKFIFSFFFPNWCYSFTCVCTFTLLQQRVGIYRCYSFINVLNSSCALLHACVWCVCFTWFSKSLLSLTALLSPWQQWVIFFWGLHTDTCTQSKCGNNVSVSFFRVNQEAEQSDNFVQQVSSSYTVLWSRLMYKFVSLCVFNGCEYILTFLHSFRWHAHEKGAHSKKNVFI